VSGQRICALAEEAAEAANPEVALETLTRIREELQEFERQQVARALTGGRSYGDVARAMGITRQAAHRRFRDLAKPRRSEPRQLRPTPEVRLVFQYARSEAQALGASVLAPLHVLLGILRNGDRRAAAALSASGLDLESARAAARAAGVNGGKADGRAADRVDIRAMLADTAQCARQRGAREIEVEHVLRSALASEEQRGGGVLERLGLTPDRVLAELDAAPQDDASCLEA
jgi:ATP-dependent Clp protease ATP-binding subunit ClpA